jgi:hypothetical protein
MEAFQERMVNEYKELNDKVEKLDNFIYSNPLFDKLDKKEKFLQIQQLTGMRVYLTSLISRLEHQSINVSEL